jgi:hypothetical protein
MLQEEHNNHIAAGKQQAAELLEALNELDKLDKRRNTDERTELMLNILDDGMINGYDILDLKMLQEKFKQRERDRERKRERDGEGVTDSSEGRTTPEIETQRETQREAQKEAQSASGSTSSGRPIEANHVDVSLVIF